MLVELVKTALIGTSRGAVPPSPPGPVADMLASLPTTDAESQLLEAVAVLSRYETCGRAPAAVASIPSPAVADVRPACSRRAADLLAGVLAMTDTPAKRQLLEEWLSLANAAGHRVPHAAIPPLLNYAAGHRAVRDAVAAAIDQRGAWLMSLNPKWRVGVGEHDDPAEVWTTGTKDQRLSALRKLRATEPTAALGLIQSTWKEDGSTDRMAFVEALAVGLSDADEPFLESALDDRSNPVRTAAAALLARLPTSALVRRMTERADAMLTCTANKVTVALPAAFDKSWERDGVAEKVVVGRGQRQWWLSQIVGMVPPTHWSSAWGIEATKVVANVPSDFADLLFDAWADGVRRHPDVAWASAILAVRPRVDLLDGLPTDGQRALATQLLRSARADEDVLVALLQRTSFPFDPRSAGALFDRIDRHVRDNDGKPDYRLGSMLDAVALRVPPNSYDELAERWAGPAWAPYRKPVDGCLSTLQVRRDIQKEFTK